MSQNQGIGLFLVIVLIALGAARSQSVSNFFKSGTQNISTNLAATAQGKPITSTDVLDWHLFIYWGVAIILVVALSEVAPRLTYAILGLIIFEELLVHWNTYAGYLKIPTK